jgi:transposase
LGRSRGGFTSKLHLITDGRGRPISIGLTGGNVNDTTMLEPALGEIRVPPRVSQFCWRWSRGRGWWQHAGDAWFVDLGG